MTVETPEVYVFPTSYAQQRLWFLDRLMPGSWAYNLTSAYRLAGELNVPALEKTFSEMVKRHEILRTTFKAIDNALSQVISDAVPVHLPVIDLRALDAVDREARVKQCMHEEFCHVFDLERGPLLRLSLLKLGDAEHVLVKNMHHIISDLWSENVFLNEWLALYESFSQGREPTLPALPVQYADFSEWQRQNLQGEFFEKQLGYWKKKLEGAPSAIALQSDKPRPKTPDFSGAAAGFTLSSDTAAAVRELAKREGVTPFIALLTAFKVLLYRYTGQRDVVAGSPIANRGRAEIEPLIGLFLNTLVMRTQLDEGAGFSDALKRVRDTALGAFEHQDLPFEMLVEKLRPERGITQNPLCQVMFVLQRAVEPVGGSAGLTITPVKLDEYVAKFDLLLSLTEKGEGIEGALIYSTALFNSATMERMARHFQSLLASIVKDSKLAIRDLPMFGQDEIERQLHEWNPKPVDFKGDVGVHVLFEEQAVRTPEKLAVTDEDGSISYGELNERANRLASRLRAEGIGQRTLVATSMERSIDLIVAFLAILKTGGAYVPIDPAFPAARMSLIIDETKSPILLTQRKREGDLSGLRSRLVFVDESKPSDSAAEIPATKTSGGESPAYVIYTSGSTGTPKGVMVPHRAINRLVINTDYAQLNGADVVAHASNCAFDAATFEIWGALLNGASLVVINKETLLSPLAFRAVVEKHSITALFLTTALFNHLSADNPAIFRGVKHLLVGGEQADAGAMRAVLEAGAPQRLLNVYGPTEATTFATWHSVSSVAGEATAIPIGRPIANTWVYLLEAHRRLVPEGVRGEICIGGPGLALGYINSPELTAARFVEDPFNPGSRLYRTGDWGRYLPDGSVVFEGRMDDQVKIRGFRIEPGEIAAALKKHPSVSDAVVIVREDIPGEKRLAAYVVKAGEQSPAAGELTVFLRSRLPDYMIPSAIVVMEALPLNANGKIERSALPAPRTTSSDFVGPRNALERDLAEIWKEVIGCGEVGIGDDFFDLGGHSLMAVRLFSEIEKRLGRKLPLATLFEAPNIEHLAEVIQQEGWSAPWSPLVPIQPQGKLEPFFCIHGGDGGVLFYSKLASLLDPEQPVYGIQAQGLDGGEIVHRSLKEIAALYLKEIRGVQPKGPYFLGGYSFGGLAAFEIAQQMREQGEEVALVALFDANNPKVPARRYTLPERIALRLSVMRMMSMKDRLAFLWKRGAGKLAVMIAVRRDKHLLASWNERVKSGDSVPADHRSRYIHEMHTKAFTNYEPHVFDGKLTVFRAENPNDGFQFDPHLGWDGYAKGGVEILDVPGEHETMFHEPHVQKLADALKYSMDKARSRVRA